MSKGITFVRSLMAIIYVYEFMKNLEKSNFSIIEIQKHSVIMLYKLIVTYGNCFLGSVK